MIISTPTSLPLKFTKHEKEILNEASSILTQLHFDMILVDAEMIDACQDGVIPKTRIIDVGEYLKILANNEELEVS